MPLRKAKGNMFSFITHTWNPIKGACCHDCSYCYMKRWGTLTPPHFDKTEWKFDLGENNFIFIGTSIDIFAPDISGDWLRDYVFSKAANYNNKYLLQTKNPERMLMYTDYLTPSKFVLSTTIETNYYYPRIMNKCPSAYARAAAMSKLPKEFKRMVTIEPIIKFDLAELVAMVMAVDPVQINIGADSQNKGLPEPTAKETMRLIEMLEKYKTVIQKPNLKRIL